MTNLIRSGADVVLVAEIAGHRRLDASRRYSLPPEADRDARRWKRCSSKPRRREEPCSFPVSRRRRASSSALTTRRPRTRRLSDYDSDASYGEFLGLLRRVFAETHRVLEPGGRPRSTSPTWAGRPYVPLSHHVTAIMDELGFHIRGEIIWRKAAGASGSCAFGSWRSAANPVLRDVHEYVLVFSKGRMDRARKGDSTIGRDEFLRDTLSIWDIPAESARRVGHPAPFPVELPRRLIELYTYRGDVVLDPFLGSGSTAIAAVQAERMFVGYELDAGYARLARRRVREAEPDLTLRLKFAGRNDSGIGTGPDERNVLSERVVGEHDRCSDRVSAAAERAASAVAAGRTERTRPAAVGDGSGPFVMSTSMQLVVVTEAVHRADPVELVGDVGAVAGVDEHGRGGTVTAGESAIAGGQLASSRSPAPHSSAATAKVSVVGTRR